jgi:hypothetical protein
VFWGDFFFALNTRPNGEISPNLVTPSMLVQQPACQAHWPGQAARRSARWSRTGPIQLSTFTAGRKYTGLHILHTYRPIHSVYDDFFKAKAKSLRIVAMKFYVVFTTSSKDLFLTTASEKTCFWKTFSLRSFLLLWLIWIELGNALSEFKPDVKSQFCTRKKYARAWLKQCM